MPAWFAFDIFDRFVGGMIARRAELIGEIHYNSSYRLAYIRGPEGIIVGLAEQLVEYRFTVFPDTEANPPVESIALSK